MQTYILSEIKTGQVIHRGSEAECMMVLNGLVNYGLFEDAFELKEEV
jgi:hypothetical protein